MYIYWDAVSHFRCQQCGLCCRRDWLITVDETSYRRNRAWFAANHNEAEFTRAFQPLATSSGIGEYAAIAKKPAGGCWFLEDNSLCRLHRLAGHQHLDSVCQVYPRFPVQTARGTEITLSFSCPAVLALVSRPEPLVFIRADEPPIPLNPESCTASVFPSQQPAHSPLRYYFELEFHFIDLIQNRRLPLAPRVELVARMAEELAALQDDEPQTAISRCIEANFAVLDAAPAEEASPELTADILSEHYLANFIFKKPFYLYGLQQGSTLLRTVWRLLAKAAAASADPLSATRQTIMELELEYGHNRQALLLKCGAARRTASS